MLVCAFALTGCWHAKKDVNANQPQTGRSCDESCTQDDDTITVEGIWLKPTDVPDGATPTAELVWTVDGVVQHDESRTYTGGGTTYHAWYHSWKKNKYPRISITVDTNVHGGLWCKILYKPAGKPVDVVDWEQLGPKAPPGKVTCTSDAWLNTHLNHDE
jgi:hypothetical protein